jgi:hypothetical protein
MKNNRLGTGRVALGILAFLAFVGHANATLIVSTSCFANSTSTTGIYSCTAKSPQNGLATASIGPITTTLSEFSFSLTNNVVADAFPSPAPPNSVEQGPASAFASIEDTLDFTTPGVARAGFIKLDAYISENRGSSGETTGTLGFNSSDVTTVNQDNSCCGHLMAFELGTPFVLDLGATLEVVGGADMGASEGDVDTVVNFQIFEADGVTPVPISEAIATPEPGELTGLGLAALFALYLRRLLKDGPR